MEIIEKKNFSGWGEEGVYILVYVHTHLSAQITRPWSFFLMMPSCKSYPIKLQGVLAMASNMEGSGVVLRTQVVGAARPWADGYRELAGRCPLVKYPEKNCLSRHANWHSFIWPIKIVLNPGKWAGAARNQI